MIENKSYNILRVFNFLSLFFIIINSVLFILFENTKHIYLFLGALISFSIIVLINLNKKNKFSFLIPLISFILLILLNNVYEFIIGVVIIIGQVFIIKRGLIKDSYSSFKEEFFKALKLILLLLFIGLFLSMFPNNPFDDKLVSDYLIIYYFLYFISSILILRYLKAYENNFSIKGINKSNSIFILLIFISLILIVFLGEYILDIINFIYLNIISNILLFLIYIFLYPIVYIFSKFTRDTNNDIREFLDGFMAAEGDLNAMNELMESSSKGDSSLLNIINTFLNLLSSPIGLILISIFIIILLNNIFRKKKVDIEEEMNIDETISTSNINLNLFKKIKKAFKKLSIEKRVIIDFEKLIIDLEKENLVNIKKSTTSKDIKSQLIDTEFIKEYNLLRGFYLKVKYGNKTLSKSEYKVFKDNKKELDKLLSKLGS